jgi:PAS domain S-box-containing protein
MDETGQTRSGLTDTDIARLGEKEALDRIELLALTGRSLDAAVDDYEQAVTEVAEACVPAFADMCAIEVIDTHGRIGCAAYRFTASSALNLPTEWKPVGSSATSDRRPVLTFSGGEEPEQARRVRERLEAQSLIVAPITGGGATLGWLLLATGPYRRGFRPSALRIAGELSNRIGTSIQRVTLYRSMQDSVREQARAVRRLRRLATAATHLAGAATTQDVLDVACVEACVIHEANGAMARWVRPGGSVVVSRSGEVDEAVWVQAIAAAGDGQSDHGRGWVGYPLAGAAPASSGVLVVFVDELSEDEELVLISLASLVPVAFERALETEAALAHEQRLRAVVETSPVALIGVEDDATVSMANPAAQELLGWGPDPASWELQPPWHSLVLDLVTEVRERGRIIHNNVDVEGLSLSMSGAPLPAAGSGGAPSVLVAGVDLTETRQAERALAQAQRLDAMGQVAGRVAHDFNNLLTLIMGYAEMLRRGDLDARAQEMVSSIDGAARRAASLTKQMLDMTRQRVDSGAVIDLTREIGDLDEVLAKVVGPQVTLRVQARDASLKVRLDTGEMEQIVVNLVINASDAMEGEGTIDVSAEAASPPQSERRSLDLPPGPLAKLVVADDGPGMSADVLARCVEPFFTTKERGRGSGLGLPTVYGLVQERKGQMRIDSSPGAGTTVTIWIPLVEDAAPARRPSDEDIWQPGRRLTGRILFVEDDDEIRAMGVEILHSTGLEVRAFASAEDALDAARDGAPDALVTDVMLPGASGVELASQLRTLHPGIPVVYVTAYAGTTSAGKLRDSGDPVLGKPYRPDALRLAVAGVLEGPSGPPGS